MCEAVCVMMGLKPVKVPDPDDPTKKIMDFWPTSQKMMSDPKFIDSLKTYDKDNMDEHIIGDIRKKYMTNEKFTPEAAKKAVRCLKMTTFSCFPFILTFKMC